MILTLYSFPNYDPEIQQISNFSQVTISFLRDHHHRYYYYYFCVIVIATSGEEGRNAIMKEIGLGKELGDSSQENVVKFIGCVTTQSKKDIRYILSCLRAIRDLHLFLVCLFRQK